jgi:tetratricopeptide (TPR) repeat protein
VKRAVLVLAILTVTAAAVAVYQAAARQRAYRTFIARGDVALHDEQSLAAMEAYSGAIALRPDSTLAYLRRGETYQRRAEHGDLDLAARDFRSAAALDPTATRPLEELGDVLFQLQRYGRAAEAYDRCARIDDRSARVVYKLALARYRDGNLDGAIASINQALHLDDKMADANYLLGLCQREKGRTSQALAAFEHTVALSPGSIPAREQLADMYASLDRRADELEQLQLLAGLDRAHVERQVAVGLAHARARRWELAVLTLGSALERSPDNPMIYGALGRVWLESAQAHDDTGDLAKARDALEHVASTPGATSEILGLYGRVLLQTGDLERAERTLQEATMRYPLDPNALLLYATASEHQNHFAAARAALVQYGALVANDPELAPRAERIAALSMRMNDPATAVTWLRRAQMASPHEVRIVVTLAEAQLKAGDAVAARATVARGLEKEPENETLLELSRRANRRK